MHEEEVFVTVQAVVVAAHPGGIVDVLVGETTNGAQPVLGLTLNCGVGGLRTQMIFVMLSVPQLTALLLILSLIE